MSDLMIRVDDLSKQYQLGVESGVGGHLRDRISDGVRKVAGWFTRSSRSTKGDELPTIWALRDVSFTVAAGEVVGIIGGNGAGKSTLLKILSRITAPTTGRVEIRGRVASLLEVGTGFHPDLTGRENIFLNGAILGMGRAETRRKLDAIVDFAEVERFLDTPVKHYSSGMYVRLAFAVAAHLEPEILIVDEVLAVGDARFQKKCLGKMDDVARGGRTVLFVSHNMAAIQRLCNRAILLDKGRVQFSGEPRTTVERYLSSGSHPRYEAAARTGKPQVLSAELQDRHGQPVARVFSHDEITVNVAYVVPPGHPDTRVGIGVLSMDGIPLFTSGSRDAGVDQPAAPGEYTARITIPADVLLAGEFQLATCLWNTDDILDWQEPALTFGVDPGASEVYADAGARKGFVHIACGWVIEPVREQVRQ